MPRANRADDPVIQPAKIFDNVYAIGNVGTVANVIQTSAGLMMIDALGAWLSSRGRNDANPFAVGRAEYQKFLDVMEGCSRIALARPRTLSGRSLLELLRELLAFSTDFVNELGIRGELLAQRH